MDKPTLVDADMKAGEALLKKLDEIEFDIKAALWFYQADSEEWRLILASPTVDKEGPKEAYEKVQSELAKLQGCELSLENISLISPKDNLVKVLKGAIRTGPGISHIRFSRNVLDNVLIEDAYIYRVA